jgi:hypothetical protein
LLPQLFPSSHGVNLLRKSQLKFQIDNFDGSGPRDYTSALQPTGALQVTRKLNQPGKLIAALVSGGLAFVPPAEGGRVTLAKADATLLFTGFLDSVAALEFMGRGAFGPVYRCVLTATSDEVLLQEKTLAVCSPFINRTAGSALKQLTQDTAANIFDVSAVQDVDIVVDYPSDPQKTWSVQASEIATHARANYQLTNNALSLDPIGALTHILNESDAAFSPQGLKVQPVAALINDLTVIGEIEPQAYVTDYFVGDGLTLKFYLSQKPFTKTSKTLFDEEYLGAQLDPTRWNISDPSSAISVAGGSLLVAGGTGSDGATTVDFFEQIEMGGALVLQHGDVLFSAPSTGVIGGLYAGAVGIGGCLAGFQITPNGTQNNIQALIDGAATGPVVTTILGHHYVMTTRIYSREIYRCEQIFHSSLHPAGAGIGGAMIPADVRLVLEVHDIDPSNPASQIAPSVVLYDGIVADAPSYCTYALINAVNLHCAVAFTAMIDAVDTEVRSALPGNSYQTLLVGTLSSGAACSTSSTDLSFFTAYVPAANQNVVVRYRGAGRALARVTSPASILSQQRGSDDGVHGSVRHVKLPPARRAADCESAALAILDDSVSQAWAGEYDAWSDFLPGGAEDIFPGDALNVVAPSRGISLTTIAREVAISVEDIAGEHSRYKIQFANDAAKSLSFEFDSSKLTTSLDVNSIPDVEVGTIYLDDLTSAQVTEISSTTVTIDAGNAAPVGGGFEVRWSDQGWGMGNDRNLLGRFNTQTFTLPRLTRVQTFFLQQYNSSNRPQYSRYSASLHIDYPLGSTL